MEEKEQSKIRNETKKKSERIFDLEDQDGGDIISMDDILRKSEEKKRKK